MTTPGSQLPALDDHAFANGGSFELGQRPAGRGDRLAAWLMRRLEGARQRQLAGEVSKQFYAGAVCGERLRLAGGARLINRDDRDSVRIGRDCVIRGIVRNERGGRIDIGSEVYVGDDTLISVAQKLVIGDQTLLAHRVQIFDNASHPRDANERAEHFRMMLGLTPKRAVAISSSPVKIGRNCWICTGAIILPGSVIGDRAIVSAGSVVKGEVPADVVYGTGGGTSPIGFEAAEIGPGREPR